MPTFLIWHRTLELCPFRSSSGKFSAGNSYQPPPDRVPSGPQENQLKHGSIKNSSVPLSGKKQIKGCSTGATPGRFVLLYVRSTTKHSFCTCHNEKPFRSFTYELPHGDFLSTPGGVALSLCSNDGNSLDTKSSKRQEAISLGSLNNDPYTCVSNPGTASNIVSLLDSNDSISSIDHCLSVTYFMETSHEDPPQTTQSREMDFSLLGSTIEDTYATIPKSLSISITNTAPNTNNVKNDNIQCIQGETICSPKGNTSAETNEDGGAGEMNCIPLKIKW